jgi:hypothetical protein
MQRVLHEIMTFVEGPAKLVTVPLGMKQVE